MFYLDNTAPACERKLARNDVTQASVVLRYIFINITP